MVLEHISQSERFWFAKSLFKTNKQILEGTDTSNIHTLAGKGVKVDNLRIISWVSLDSKSKMKGACAVLVQEPQPFIYL